MKKLKIAFWSFGEHASRNILPTLRNHKFFEVVGIHSKSGVFAHDIVDIPIFSNVEEMFATLALDAVYICNPNGMHSESVLRTLTAKCHVIVEKTAFVNPREAEKASELSRKDSLIIYEAFMFKHHPQFKKLEQILKSKEFGIVQSANIRFSIPERKSEDIRYQDKLGGGALNDLGAYTIESSQKLFSADVDLLASGMGFANRSVDVNGWAKFAGDGIDVNCSWAFDTTYCNQIILWCSDATIIVERAFSKPSSFRSAIIAYRDGKVLRKFETGQANHFETMFDDFALRIQSNDRTSVSELIETNSAMQKVREFSKRV